MRNNLREILRGNNTERRAIGRTLINRNAFIFLSSHADVYSCSVRDVTNRGAGIRLDGLKIVSLDFDLSFDNFHTIRECQMIWRERDFAGVQLIN
jgi:hypothetical protein